MRRTARHARSQTKHAPGHPRFLDSTKLFSSFLSVCQSLSLPRRPCSFCLSGCFSSQFHVCLTRRFICNASPGRAWQLLFLSCVPGLALILLNYCWSWDFWSWARKPGRQVSTHSRTQQARLHTVGKFRGVDDASEDDLNGPHFASHSDASLLHCRASSVVQALTLVWAGK